MLFTFHATVTFGYAHITILQIINNTHITTNNLFIYLTIYLFIIILLLLHSYSSIIITAYSNRFVNSSPLGLILAAFYLMEMIGASYAGGLLDSLLIEKRDASRRSITICYSRSNGLPNVCIWLLLKKKRYFLGAFIFS